MPMTSGLAWGEGIHSSLTLSPFNPSMWLDMEHVGCRTSSLVGRPAVWRWSSGCALKVAGAGGESPVFGPATTTPADATLLLGRENLALDFRDEQRGTIGVVFFMEALCGSFIIL
uniref:Uncharacterized protein n=1 Tax=Leersia perrieri TaxID=77586 RepID=A0A0D9Y0P4_9ORYZ